MSDLKPRGQKAPLNLLPHGPLGAVAGVMEHGATKYSPWNWQDSEQPQAEMQELVAAMMRHLTAVGDPSIKDYDEESGLHHIAHVACGALIYLWKAGIDYKPSLLLADADDSYVDDGTWQRGEDAFKAQLDRCPRCRTAGAINHGICSHCDYPDPESS